MSICGRLTSVLSPLFNFFFTWLGIHEPSKEKRVGRDSRIEGGHIQVCLQPINT